MISKVKDPEQTIRVRKPLYHPGTQEEGPRHLSDNEGEYENIFWATETADRQKSGERTKRKEKRNESPKLAKPQKGPPKKITQERCTCDAEPFILGSSLEQNQYHSACAAGKQRRVSGKEGDPNKGRGQRQSDTAHYSRMKGRAQESQ